MWSEIIKGLIRVKHLWLLLAVSPLPSYSVERSISLWCPENGTQDTSLPDGGLAILINYWSQSRIKSACLFWPSEKEQNWSRCLDHVTLGEYSVHEHAALPFFWINRRTLKTYVFKFSNFSGAFFLNDYASDRFLSDPSDFESVINGSYACFSDEQGRAEELQKLFLENAVRGNQL